MGRTKRLPRRGLERPERKSRFPGPRGVVGAQEPVVIQLGRWIEGSLGAGDQPLPGDEFGMVAHYVLPADFSGPAVVILESEEFDTLLRWGVLSLGVLDILDINDDGGGVCEGPQEGCGYRIRVDVPAPPPPAIRREYGAETAYCA